MSLTSVADDKANSLSIPQFTNRNNLRRGTLFEDVKMIRRGSIIQEENEGDDNEDVHAQLLGSYGSQKSGLNNDLGLESGLTVVVPPKESRAFSISSGKSNRSNKSHDH